MVRRRKDVDWVRFLPPEDLRYLREHIDAEAWYPMASFERLGIAILSHVAGATLEAVRLWGRFSASHFAEEHPELIARNEPVETLMRLRVLRKTLFDFSAFDIPMLADGQAHVVMTYHMCDMAEEAACCQTMGFCEGVLSLAGADQIRARFLERAWLGDSRTLLNLEWDSASI